jgi:zinc finger protein CreA/MIG
VEPAADGHHPYVPVQHSGLRISEIMQAGDGAQRKLPIPIVQGKDSSFAVRDLIHPDGGRASGHNSARASEAGNDLHERY